MSIVNEVALYGTREYLWSDSRSERQMAAQFIQTGELLASQRESNQIQQELCSIARVTNSLLSELVASQAVTNEILTKSLDVQVEQLRMAKRERLLKDALFRWLEIWAEEEPLKDPHWVVVASRAYQAFLSSADYTTQDLSEAAEKKNLTTLSRNLANLAKEIPHIVNSEVNVFEALYAEFIALRDTPHKDTIPEPVSANVPYPQTEVLSLMSECWGVEPKVTSWYPVHRITGWTSPLEAYNGIRQNLEVQNILFVVYGKPSAFRANFAVFTDREWHELTTFGLIDNSVKHSYLTDSLEWNTADWPAVKANAAETFGKANEFIRGMREILMSYQALVEATQKQTDARNAEAVEIARRRNDEARQQRTERLQTACCRINEFLDLHPHVRTFYPPVEVS